MVRRGEGACVPTQNCSSAGRVAGTPHGHWDGAIELIIHNLLLVVVVELEEAGVAFGVDLA